MKLSKETYDTLAWLGRIGLPALSVLYATIGKIWNLPFTEQIPLTITALAVFINALLGINSKQFFNEHDIVKIEEDDDGVSFTD